MKKINIIAGWLICMLLCSSCDKFLELTPRDKIVVSKIEDYRDILASYMRFLKTPNRSQELVFGLDAFATPRFDVAANLGIYTGETTLLTSNSYYYDNNKSEYTPIGKSLLTWQNTESYTWERYYSFLGPINLIISGIAKAEGHDEELRNYVKGEALVWRAFAYYKLLQYYAPYKNNKYGVPIYLTPDQDIGNAMPPRNTLSEVFAQVLGDCNEALNLLEITASSDWNCAYRYDFINAMMASVYTWKAMSAAAEATDWEKASQCATEAMTGRVLANTPEVLKQMFDCKDVNEQTQMTNDEFYFRIMDGSWGQVGNLKNAYYEKGISDGIASVQYYFKFRDGDIRTSSYFKGSYNDKYNLIGSANGACFILFRLAEMYLIKAEALVRQGKVGEACAVLEVFVQARYPGIATAVPSDAALLLQEILDERIREFYLENDMRWLDMKRLGVTVEKTVGGEKFVLEPNDFRYCFPIPKKELELNKNMEQTPGWEKVMF